MSLRYFVEDYADGRYFLVRGYDDLQGALEELRSMGAKARIKHAGKVVKYNHNFHATEDRRT